MSALVNAASATAANVGDFRIASYFLGSLYLVLAIWSLWKLTVFASISWPWTGQKSIHAFVAAAATVRSAFFFVIPTMPRVFFLVEVTAPSAPVWVSILDDLPFILVLGMMSVLTLTWASSYYNFKRNEQYYRRWILRPFKWLFALLCLAQLVMWIVIGTVAGSNDALAVAEGSMYAVAFGCSAYLVFLYGQRTSSVALGVSVLGLSSRTLLRRQIMLQAVVCAMAFALRALISLGAAIAAAIGVDDRFDETSAAGIAVTVSVCILLDIAPISVILLQNRKALGKSQIPGPAKLLRPVGRFLCFPCFALARAVSGGTGTGGLGYHRAGAGSLNDKGVAGSSGGGGLSTVGVFIGRGFGSPKASSMAMGMSIANDSTSALHEVLIGGSGKSSSSGSLGTPVKGYGALDTSDSSVGTSAGTYQAPEPLSLPEPLEPDGRTSSSSSSSSGSSAGIPIAARDKRFSLASSASGSAMVLPASLDMARSTSAAAPTSSSSLYKSARNQRNSAFSEALHLSSPFSPGSSVDPTSILMATGGKTAALALAAIASAAGPACPLESDEEDSNGKISSAEAASISPLLAREGPSDASTKPAPLDGDDGHELTTTSAHSAEAAEASAAVSLPGDVAASSSVAASAAKSSKKKKGKR